MSDPGYLSRQYSTDTALRTRIETHVKYGTGERDQIFNSITAAMLERSSRPEAILDVGAGTGNWYRAIRQALGPAPRYTGVDQSTGMVEALTAAINGDPLATAQAGDAEALPFVDQSFDWVGMHFMLYHVPHIRRGLGEAWRVLKPGGVLAAATNGATPYRELWDLGNQVAAELGLPGAAGQRSDSFNLGNGAEFFPAPPSVQVLPAGFRFPEARPALRYMASGPLWFCLGDAASDAATRERAMDLLRDKIEAVIRREGTFDVHSETGFFLLTKD